VSGPRRALGHGRYGYSTIAAADALGVQEGEGGVREAGAAWCRVRPPARLA
jgi:hypothetical protein